MEELGERKRRPQFKASSALSPCDGDGPEEGVFAGFQIMRSSLERYFTADAMSLCFVEQMTELFHFKEGAANGRLR